MLVHRLGRWPNIVPALGQCPVFAAQVPQTTGMQEYINPLVAMSHIKNMRKQEREVHSILF